MSDFDDEAEHIKCLCKSLIITQKIFTSKEMMYIIFIRHWIKAATRNYCVGQCDSRCVQCHEGTTSAPIDRVVARQWTVALAGFRIWDLPGSMQRFSFSASRVHSPAIEKKRFHATNVLLIFSSESPKAILGDDVCPMWIAFWLVYMLVLVSNFEPAQFLM